MNTNLWVGVLAALVLVGAVLFGGIGGMTFVVMIAVLAGGILLFRSDIKRRRRT